MRHTQRDTDEYTDRQQGDLISLSLSFRNNEIGLINEYESAILLHDTIQGGISFTRLYPRASHII
jgi:hypothetical protein